MRLYLRLLLMVVVMFAVLFGCAGRLDLPFFWAYLALTFAVFCVVIRVMDPDLVKERMHPGPGGTDRNLRFVAVPFWLAHLIVAGLDAGRFGWSGELPLWLKLAGLAGFAFGLALAVWAMSVNRFFSPVVRIQSERGHRLITAGPYACVRHPGYLSTIVAFPSASIALGSW